MTDITVYLPDKVGEAAKAAGLPFSRLLCKAVEDELRRRQAVVEQRDWLLNPPGQFGGGT
jgi:post-segregation antitoxin (ccd killing protein)